MVRLQLNQISKYFPGVKALVNVDFQLLAGEVHALCGENGAGKSTLMNILTGNLQPDQGEIVRNGQNVTIENPAHANRLGIAIVYQQLSLSDNLSVAENIFANQQPRNRWGLIQYKTLFEQTQQLLDQLRIVGIKPQTQVAELSPGQKQMVEIAKALSRQPSILILDEPTASITDQEIQTLFQIIRQLQQQGVSVIYISHRMAEIFTIADRITVLKDGRHQGTFDVGEVTRDELIRRMVGRDISHLHRQSSVQNSILLEVKTLTSNRFRNLSFQLRAGEILGLAGLVGAGRTEIARAIFGADPIASGEMYVQGKQLSAAHPSDAIRAGLGYVPEERKTLGLFLEKQVRENIVAAWQNQSTQSGWFHEATVTRLAEEYKEKLRIATPSVFQQVVHLSGGNQQKVVLAKWLLSQPDVLIVDEPTHGIDVGAKYEIYELLHALAQQGKGILLISSELPEIIGLCDRILVIREGELAGELNQDEATEENILRLAAL
jgi:ribose transport system ATP-binding protein